jgi:hypothetical protein
VPEGSLPVAAALIGMTVAPWYLGRDARLSSASAEAITAPRTAASSGMLTHASLANDMVASTSQRRITGSSGSASSAVSVELRPRRGPTVRERSNASLEVRSDRRRRMSGPAIRGWDGFGRRETETNDRARAFGTLE